jgi:hypothetical protein
VVSGRIGRGCVSAVDSFVVVHEIPVQRFQKGDVKEDIAREHFKAAEREGRFGVVMVAIAQEKTACEDPAALGETCSSLQAADVHAFFDRFGRRVNSRRPWRFTPPA